MQTQNRAFVALLFLSLAEDTLTFSSKIALVFVLNCDFSNLFDVFYKTYVRSFRTVHKIFESTFNALKVLNIYLVKILFHPRMQCYVHNFYNQFPL